MRVENPWNGEVVGEVEETGEEELESAIAQAHAAHLDRRARLPKHARVAILEKTAALMERDFDQLVRTAVLEGGKPHMDTVSEVERAIEGVKLAAHHLFSLAGREIPMDLNPASERHLAFTQMEPRGVVFSASAFNHPLNLAVHQVAPAVAVGAPVIFKPAMVTPMSGKKLVKLFHEAGLEEHWCRFVLTSNELTTQAVGDRRLGFFSFIGSSPVGEMLRSKLAPGVECALEHGGAAPVIVEADADLEEALPGLVKAGFYHAGQVCVSVQRVFAHESIAEKLADAIVDRASKLVVGDPMDPDTVVGPLISPAAVEKVETWVREAEQAGGKVLCGGSAVHERAHAYRAYAPTVIYDPPDYVKLSCQEVFGPVVVVYPYKDRDKAIERANAVPFAFQAAVYTRDLDIGFDTARRLKSTVAMVNEHPAFRVDWMPFGGFEESGVRMGGIPLSMRDMTHEKMFIIKSRGV